MQDSIMTTIMQVGKPMKVQTTEYIIFHYKSTEAHPKMRWDQYRQIFPTKQKAIDEIELSKSFKTRKPDEYYKLIERITIETEIEL